MSQTLTDRVEAIKNTPGTGENVLVAEINSAFDKFDNHFIPAAKLRNTVAQSVPNNAVTGVVYNTVVYDSYAARSEGAMANAATETITIRKTGLYLIVNKVAFLASVVGVRRLDINKNGALFHTKTRAGFTGGANVVDISTIEVLTAGDTITSSAYQNFGSALDTDPGNNGVELSVAWLGTVVEV